MRYTFREAEIEKEISVMRVSRQKRDFKTLAIGVLLAAALYQTGTLWLENYSGHNFFYYIASLNSAAQKENEVSAVLDAEYITVGYGSKVFNVLYGKSAQELKKSADKVIKEAAEKKDMEELEEINLPEIIDKKAVIYSMPCESLVSEYLNALDAKTKENISFGFSSVVVAPSSGIKNEDEVYFINSDESKALIFRGNCESGKNLYDLIDKKATDSYDSLQYISTAQNGFNIFGKNVFVPQWSQSRLDYAVIEERNAFDDAGDNDLLAKIEPFFGSYHGQTWDRDDSGAFTVSDNDIVVKYSPDGMLEYYSYKVDSSESVQSVYSAYKACTEFLALDESITSDYYLSQVQFKSNTMVFCFDYCVDSIPVMLYDPSDENAEERHAIEVAVKNNSVKNYRRYAVDFVKSGETAFAEKDFLSAVNEAAADASENGALTDIENIMMCYGKNSEGNYSLKWFTYISGTVYAADTKNS